MTRYQKKRFYPKACEMSLNDSAELQETRDSNGTGFQRHRIYQKPARSIFIVFVEKKETLKTERPGALLILGPKEGESPNLKVKVRRDPTNFRFQRRRIHEENLSLFKSFC